MFRDTLKIAIDDMFEHLGGMAKYQPRDGAAVEVIAFAKEPENPYELGDSQHIDQVAVISVKSEEVTPKIGEFIEINGRTYKIFEEPLLDASNFIWKFLGVLVKK